MAQARAAGSPRSRWRTAVHLLLIAVVVGSLILEPVLTLHIVLGLIFTALVVVHLGQRRRTVTSLVTRIPRLAGTRAGRMAVADLWLAALTVAMLASGLVDWWIGHPTRIRWHAITGVVLAATLVVHTLRRRRRLTGSLVR